MTRPLRPTWIRFIAPGLCVALVTGLPPRALAQPTVRLEFSGTSPPATGGDALFRRANEAAERRDFAAADDLYRRAWEDPATRALAATGLKALHRTPGFKLSADPDVVAATLTRLGRGFARRDTPHFVILSDCDLRWTQARGDILERTWAQFFRVADRLGLDACPPKHRLLCILFNQRDDYLAFGAARDGLKSPWVGGYYANASNHVVFYNDASSPAQVAAAEKLATARELSRKAREKAAQVRRDGDEDHAIRLLTAADEHDIRIRDEERRLAGLTADVSTSKTIHEAIHLLAFNTGVQLRDREYPFWLTEGLATAFETDRPTAAFGPDRSAYPKRLEDYRRLLAEGKLPPLANLILVNDVSRVEADTVETLYSQSHALFAYLYSRDPAALGRYIKLLSESRHGGAAEHAALFSSTFGDPSEVEKQMKASISDRPRRGRR